MAGRDQRLSDEQVSAVFRRAAEIDQGADRVSPGLDRAAVERAAVEAGLSLEAVRAAIAEVEAGGLERRTVSGRGWPEATVTVHREVPIGAAAAGARIDAFLRSQTMRVCRRRGGVTVWEPAEGVAAKVARGVDLSGRVRLKAVSCVTVAVDGDASSCQVRISLDLSRTRREKLAGAIAGTSFGALVAGGGVVGAVAASDLALVAVPAGGAIATASWLAARADFTKRLERAVNAVELVLDELDDSAFRRAPHARGRR